MILESKFVVCGIKRLLAQPAVAIKKITNVIKKIPSA